MKKLIYTLILFLFTTTTQAQQAGWIELPQIRNQQENTIVGEIKNRIANTSLMSGEDNVGQGHYGGHAANSYVRNKYGRGFSTCASYMIGGFCFICPQPKEYTLQEVIAHTPGYYPGGTTGWNNEPLYILDELSAYTCGTIAGLQTGPTNTRTLSSYKFAKDILRHAKTACELGRQRGYPYTKELENYIQHVERIHKTVIDPNL